MPNPFQIQLMEALARTGRLDVFHGAGRLYWDEPYDIVHFQWPEASFNWRIPSAGQVQAFKQAIRQHKRNARIVTTVHNFRPQPGMEDVYSTVYRATDCFIHLTDTSKAHFERKYPHRRHVVIPHGDYGYYERLPADDAALQEARADGNAGPMLLVFGALREAVEEELARRAFEAAAVTNARLVFAGDLSFRIPTKVAARIRKRQDPGIVRLHRRIEVDQVAPLIGGSRFLFLPRTGRLNSGVISLAMTFGKPIIVPDDATSSHLSALGLPTYLAGDAASAGAAMRHALAMPDAEYDALVARIVAHRDATMRWSDIASRHVELYGELADWKHRVKRLARAVLRR